MSTLTKRKIIERLSQDNKTALIVSPILSKKQIGDASIDLRLGNQFILFRLHIQGAFEPFCNKSTMLRKLQERQVVNFGNSFYLHPGMLALGSTFEYLSIPRDIECQVEGRSSWARVGLQICTASSVEPGFKGVLTLELSNVGTVPIKLYPGIRIAQIVFHTADPPAKNPYRNTRKYLYPIGPEFSKIEEDKDAARFIRNHRTG